MAVRKLTSGRWEASYRDPSGRERTKRYRTRAEADRWLTSVKGELNRGDWVDPSLGRTPFSRWATEWLEGSSHLKPKTRADYEGMLRVHVLPTFGHRTVGSITSSDVRRFIADEVASGAAPGTVRGARKVLRLVLGVAQSEGAIRSNPCDGVRVPASPKAEMVFLTADEVEQLAIAIGPRYSTMIRVAAYTGMRAGEIEALRVGRVDLDAGRLTIAESVTEVQGMGLVFGQPKTYERRSVTLPPSLTAELARHLQDRPTDPERDRLHCARRRCDQPQELLPPGVQARPVGRRSAHPDAVPRSSAHLRRSLHRPRRPPQGHPGAPRSLVDHRHARPVRAPLPQARRGPDDSPRRAPPVGDGVAPRFPFRPVESLVGPRSPRSARCVSRSFRGPRRCRRRDGSDRRTVTWGNVVWPGRFELPTPCSQSRCATKLRHGQSVAG